MKTIAIVAGGNSSEYKISIKSAIEVKNELCRKYETFIIIIKGTDWYWEDPTGKFYSIDKNDFSLTNGDKKIRFDAVFVAIHGTPGENGLLQGYFDMLNIPYTSCGAFTSALTFNKQACKLFLKEYGIEMADAILIRKKDDIEPEKILDQLGLPCFVKPNDSGSSFGVTKVKSAKDFIPALEEAFRESDEVLAESFMEGRELACGVVKTSRTMRTLILPLTEIITKNDFFDYEAKYTPGFSSEITPAQINDEITERIKELSSRIYDLLGCRGIVRVDFIVVGSAPFFLEINSVPGMTRESLVPQQAEAAGIRPGEIYSMVVDDLFD